MYAVNAKPAAPATKNWPSPCDRNSLTPLVNEGISLEAADEVAEEPDDGAAARLLLGRPKPEEKSRCSSLAADLDAGPDRRANGDGRSRDLRDRAARSTEYKRKADPAMAAQRCLTPGRFAGRQTDASSSSYHATSGRTSPKGVYRLIIPGPRLASQEDATTPLPETE